MENWNIDIFSSSFYNHGIIFGEPLEFKKIICFALYVCSAESYTMAYIQQQLQQLNCPYSSFPIAPVPKWWTAFVTVDSANIYLFTYLPKVAYIVLSSILSS